MFASNSFSARDPNHTSQKSTAYLSASMMGSQPDSRKRTAPTCRFGTASRFGPSKAMITKQHAEAVQQGQESPGPVYKHKDHFGRLKSSVGKQGATFKFGTGQRKDMNSEPGSSGATSTYQTVPGPGTYASATASVGRQVASRAATAPTFKFGSSDREQQSKLYLPGADTEMQGKCSPGPSAYYPKMSVGDNAPTQHKAAVYSFGGDAMYDAVAKETPRSNPGPGEHEHPSAISTQVSSTRPTLPQYRFGKDSRLPKAPRSDREFPGCNSYFLHESTGPQVETKRKNAPVFSMGTCTRETQNKVFTPLTHG